MLIQTEMIWAGSVWRIMWFSSVNSVDNAQFMPYNAR